MLYDIAIVGGGPAGCSAAVTAANRSLGTLLLDTGDFGLALRKSHLVKLSGAAGPVRSGTDGCLYRSYEGRRDHGGPP